MKYSILMAALVSIVVFSCGDEKKNKTGDTASDTTVIDTSQMKKEVWTILFDGQSTDQWRGYNSDSIYSNWSIEDNALKFTPGEKGGKNIITKDTFENFVLSLDWKASEGANSGIFWSVFEDEKFGEAYQTGPEIQVLDNERHPDAKVAGGTHKAGSLYDMVACDPKLVNPAGEWNTTVLEIDHTKNLGKVIMNGTEALTFPVHGEEWEAMVQNSKFKDWEGFGEYRNGHIGLQDHGDVVWFRDIKIKRL